MAPRQSAWASAIPARCQSVRTNMNESPMGANDRPVAWTATSEIIEMRTRLITERIRWQINDRVKLTLKLTDELRAVTDLLYVVLQAGGGMQDETHPKRRGTIIRSLHHPS